MTKSCQSAIGQFVPSAFIGLALGYAVGIGLGQWDADKVNIMFLISWLTDHGRPDGRLRMTVAIPSELELVEHAVDLVARHCLACGLSMRAARFNLRVALSEALANAIVYGNRMDPGKRVHVAIPCDDDTAYDTKVSVYCGPCDDLVCVTGNDDNCGLPMVRHEFPK